MDFEELPTRARLEQYEKQVQDLVEGHRFWTKSCRLIS